MINCHHFGFFQHFLRKIQIFLLIVIKLSVIVKMHSWGDNVHVISVLMTYYTCLHIWYSLCHSTKCIISSKNGHNVVHFVFKNGFHGNRCQNMTKWWVFDTQAKNSCNYLNIIESREDNRNLMNFINLAALTYINSREQSY